MLSGSGSISYYNVARACITKTLCFGLSSFGITNDTTKTGGQFRISIDCMFALEDLCDLFIPLLCLCNICWF